MSSLQIQPGQAVLFVGSSTIEQDQWIKMRSAALAQAGPQANIGFEIIERVADAPLPKSSFDAIHSNIFSPSVSVHTPAILSRYLSALKAGGSLVLEEPIVLVSLSNTVCPVTRQEDELVSMLKLAGFVDVEATVQPVSDQQLAQFFQLWGATRVEQAVSRLTGKFGWARVTAKKPAYEVGQKISLRFNKKPTNTTTTTTTTTTKKSVWTLETDDTMEDDDALLDDEDLVKPSKESLARPDDCELTDGKRKACKNCTCGRAEEEEAQVVSLDLEDDMEDEIVEVDPTAKKVGGCGSCALGDAFRCSTCPYLGMPSFTPGQTVTLGGQFGMDDI
ncbi:cytokine-induced anti-apoptosis inhibitor 1, Fe-S biogenesis-domain-containing protein [Phycomyces nitens]|nr:cytokine-induced anti-apoptosis inhibitor 1, Fe-S biogenesis-domain-containing protein [Phycomyces nitens]